MKCKTFMHPIDRGRFLETSLALTPRACDRLLVMSQGSISAEFTPDGCVRQLSQLLSATPFLMLTVQEDSGSMFNSLAAKAKANKPSQEAPKK